MDRRIISGHFTLTTKQTLSKEAKTAISQEVAVFT